MKTTTTTVKITKSFRSEDGCWIEAGTIGTLMTDVGEGDWLVYIAGKGSPLVNECDFEECDGEAE